MTSCLHKMLFGILVGHDLSMRILYRFHRWLIFVRVIALFMFVWPYVRLHISCIHKMWERTYGQTNMKRAIILAKINHPWNRYNMRMLRSWPTKIPNMNKMILFIHIWYLDWPWSEHTHIIPISRMVDFYESYSPFHVWCGNGHMVKQTWKGL
jgi:hypothetical protein